MFQERYKFTDRDFEFISNRNKDWAERKVAAAMKYLTDPNKTRRLKEATCKLCFYFENTRFGGYTVTERQCGLCDEIVMYGFNATDKICINCAKTHEVCVQCAGDLHMRTSRKKPTPRVNNLKDEYDT